jgi:hypothetical protein
MVVSKHIAISGIACYAMCICIFCAVYPFCILFIWGGFFMENCNAKFRICQGYVLRKVFDEYLAIPVVAPQGSKRYIAILNPVAEFIWRQLETESKTLSQLLAEVLNEFDIDEATALADIQDFLEELRENCYLTEELEDKE